MFGLGLGLPKQGMQRREFTPTSLSGLQYWPDLGRLGKAYQADTGGVVAGAGDLIGRMVPRVGADTPQPNQVMRPRYVIAPKTGVRNILTNSEILGNWSPDGSPVATPSGEFFQSVEGARITAGAANWNRMDDGLPPLAAGQPYRVQAWVKRGTSDRVSVILHKSSELTAWIGGDFDTLGVVTVSNCTVTDFASEDVGGVTRIAATVTPDNAVSGATIGIGANGSSSETDVIAFCAQLEEGSTDTAYQRTNGLFDVSEAGVKPQHRLSFDGNDDFMSLGVGRIGDTGLFCGLGEQFTVAFMGQAAVSSTLLARAGGTQADRTFQAFRSDGGSLAVLLRGQWNTLSGITPDDVLNFVMRWDGAEARCWYNGQTKVLQVGTASEEVGEDITLGAIAGGASYHLNGWLSEPVIWDRALSDGEVAQMITYQGAA